METRAEIMRIVEKYDKNLSNLSKNGNGKEFKAVLRFIANEANKKQRALVEKVQAQHF